MQVSAYDLSVRIDPGRNPNLIASAEISLQNGSVSCTQFSLFLHPDFSLTGFSAENGKVQALNNPHPMGFAGRELKVTFDPAIQPGETLVISVQWQGRLRGIIGGYCMIAPHLVELRDFACWYPLQGGDVEGFTWKMNLDLPADGYPLSTTALCNGTIQNENTEGGRLRQNWVSQETTDINIIASNWFQHKRKDKYGLNLSIYYAFLSTPQAEDLLEQMHSAWEFFTKEIGCNEGLELNAVFSPRYAEGGYVYGPLTVMSEPQYQHYLNFPQHRPPVSVYGNAHELAHYWWREQVSVDRTTWHDWLMEALAEYWASMYDEQNEVGRSQKIYRFYAKRVVALENPLPMNQTFFQSPNRYVLWYLKGSWVIRMLSFTLGEMVFKRAIRLFYERFMGRRADTQDFIDCCQEVSRRDLGLFFSQWLQRTDLPKLSLEWQQDEQFVEITVTQHQGGQPFYLDTEILIQSGGRGRIEHLIIDKPSQTYRFPVSGQVADVQLDPRVFSLFDTIHR